MSSETEAPSSPVPSVLSLCGACVRRDGPHLHSIHCRRARVHMGVHSGVDHRGALDGYCAPRMVSLFPELLLFFPVLPRRSSSCHQSVACSDGFQHSALHSMSSVSLVAQALISFQSWCHNLCLHWPTGDIWAASRFGRLWIKLLYTSVSLWTCVLSSDCCTEW